MMDKCPKCGVSWLGELIIDSFKRQRANGSKWCSGMTDIELEKMVKDNYSEPYRWQRQIGIYLAWDHPKHIDGVSYWMCPDCKTTFNRFTEKEEDI